MRFEDERKDKREDDRCSDARARRRERTRDRVKQTFLRAADGAVRQQITEARNGDGRARAREIHEILLQPERLQNHARQHEVH